ncbi:MAG: hypothetical protein AAF497_20625 [Planctomycetota bacterium]
MKRMTRIGLLIVLASLLSAGNAIAGDGKDFGDGKFDPGNTVDIENLNEPFDPDTGELNEEADIFVWLLTAEQAATPPATVGEALDLFPAISFPLGVTSFTNLDAGEYVLVASNASYLFGLDESAPFVADTDYSAAALTVSEGSVSVTVANTDSPTLLPEISIGGSGE